MDENTSIFNTDSFIEQLNNVSGMIQENNAAAAAAAEDQRNWTERMWQKQSEFNAEEAAKNREWQEYMSNSAHQREVADLRAAGLNPILSASGGNGAAVTSGATASSSVGSGVSADTDHSGTSALVSLLNGFLQSQTSLLNQTMSARTNEAIADKYVALDQLLAEMNNATSRYVSDNSLKGAQTSAGAAVYAANKNYETQKMVQDAYETRLDIENNFKGSEAEKQREWEEEMKKKYPNSDVGAVASLINALLGNGPDGYTTWNEAAKEMYDNGEMTKEQFDAITGATTVFHKRS